MRKKIVICVSEMEKTMALIDWPGMDSIKVPIQLATQFLEECEPLVHLQFLYVEIEL